MITISADMKTATLSEGAAVYTEDGETFTQVVAGEITSITGTYAGSPLRELLTDIATVGPLPEGVKPLSFKPITVA